MCLESDLKTGKRLQLRPLNFFFFLSLSAVVVLGSQVLLTSNNLD